MKIFFIDFENRANDREYQTSAKELTASGVVRILRANVPVIVSSAEAIVQKGIWISKTEWRSPSGQYSIDLVDDK